MPAMITAHVCSWLELTSRCLGDLQADRASKWKVEVGGVLAEASDLRLSFTDGSSVSQTPPTPTSPCPQFVWGVSLVFKCTSCSLCSLPPSLIGSYAPTFFHVSGSSGPHFSPGFTLLGDGPVAVAVVVRWPVCIGRQGATEAGTEDTGEWAEPGGILLFYYAVWSGCRLMLL